MKRRENAKYQLVTPTSMGVRITPINRQPVHVSREYRMHATSAESNVGQISASLGKRVKVLTNFVAGSPIAQFIKSELGFRGIEFEGPEIEQGGPWGYRHQFNVADSGFGLRGPRVHNDRAGEVGRMLNVKDFDLERIFGEEGVEIVHMSGLIAALSPEAGQFCLDIARAAKKYGTLVSFDLNHRASFWEGREEELGKIFHEIADSADILIGNEEDYQLALGIQGPEAELVEGLAEKMGGFREMVERVHQAYPNASVFANTLREVVNANTHMWGALVRVGDDWYVEEPREIQVLDRIGGGDSFVGGLLYSILSDKDPADWVKFAWATGAMAVTMENDYASPADEEQVWSFYEGNARVRR